MRTHHYTEEHSGFDFTAIMDIAFVVMVLFFGATFFLVEAGSEEPIPTEMTRYEPEYAPVWVEIDSSGLVNIDGRPYERDAIYDIIAGELASRPGAAVNIDVDPNAESGAVALVLEIVRALEVEKVNVNTGSDS